MTKTVRIENADTNTSVRVVIIIEDLSDGAWSETDRQVLFSPTQLSSNTYLTSTRRLRIEEEPNT